MFCRLSVIHPRLPQLIEKIPCPAGFVLPDHPAGSSLNPRSPLASTHCGLVSETGSYLLRCHCFRATLLVDGDRIRKLTPKTGTCSIPRGCFGRFGRYYLLFDLNGLILRISLSKCSFWRRFVTRRRIYFCPSSYSKTLKWIKSRYYTLGCTRWLNGRTTK